MSRTIKKFAPYLFIFIIACGAPEKEQGSLAEKKEKLEKLKLQTDSIKAAAKEKIDSIKEEIKNLKELIAEEDTVFAKELNRNVVLVSTIPAKQQTFTHYIEVRGSVESQAAINVSAEMGGTVKSVKVKEGSRVKKGQVLANLNSETLQNSIAELKTALDLAKTLFEKQSNIWKQNIGTEVQYLQAKNNKESLERKLETTYSQLDKTIIKAPFSGIIDEIIAKEGEVTQPGFPIITMLGTKDMHIEADVSEVMLGKFNIGDPVKVELPSIDEELNSKVNAIGQVINKENRTFKVEVSLDKKNNLVKPNLLAILTFKDYENPEAIVIPSRVIHNDSEGDYVFSHVNGKAKKVRIKRGQTYKNNTEILSGLKSGDIIINEGGTEASDGAEVKVSNKSL